MSPVSRNRVGSEVGIIFMRGTDVWIDSTPVDTAVDYGALRTHDKGHPEYWAELQSRLAVPKDEEYDEVPRGRATYDTQKKCFYLFLDRCIRQRPELVARILEGLRLPPSPETEVRADPHYICPGCRPTMPDGGDDGATR